VEFPYPWFFTLFKTMENPPLKLLSLGFERYINFAFEVLSKEARRLLLIHCKITLRNQAEDIKGWMKFFGIELTEGQERDYKQRFLK